LKSQYGHLRTHHGKCTYSASGGNGSDGAGGTGSGDDGGDGDRDGDGEGDGGIWLVYAYGVSGSRCRICASRPASARARWLSAFFCAAGSCAALRCSPTGTNSGS